ncbi:hypothetical protein CT472_06395 [Salmonella enterica]|nr:hypothetical protein [Salmonella enterica]
MTASWEQREQKTEKKKQFALSHLVTIHTAPVVSVRLRVALYFVNISLHCNKGKLYSEQNKWR